MGAGENGPNYGMASFASTPQPPSGRRRWLPILIGAAVTVFIIVLAFASGRFASRPTGHTNPAYIPQVQARATQVSQADTMMAGSVIYVQGTIANRGKLPVTAAQATLRFVDPYGQLAQLSQVTLVGAQTGPLPAGQSRSFRVGFDHVSARWNQAPPAVKIISVYTR